MDVFDAHTYELEIDDIRSLMKESDLPVFETERLIAKRWDPAIVDQALEIYSDPLVTRHMPMMRCTTREEMLAKIEWGIERNKKWDEPLGSFPVFLKETDRMVGTALIKYLPDGDENLTDDIEIGWHLGSAYWGQGYATEFGNELLRIGFGLGLSEIFAVTGLENLPSQAVCKRLGMEHLGQTEKYYGERVELFVIRSDR